MNDKLSIYILHSEKIDYLNNLYKPLIKLNLLKNYYLYLPLSDKYKGTYIKDLLDTTDVVICILTKFNFFSKVELKYAIKSNKPIYYFIDIKENNKYKKYNCITYANIDELINKIKQLLDSLDKKSLLLKRENIYCLGKITK